MSDPGNYRGEAAPAQTPEDPRVVQAARILSERYADLCGINRDDCWNMQAPEFIDDARAVLVDCGHLKGQDDLLAALADSQALATEACSDRSRLLDEKNGAYEERNRCVALVARMALALGFKAGTARTAIEGWHESWHGCVYVQLPTGQASWHFHDSQAALFADLPAFDGAWDGHSTPEKYERVASAFPVGSAVPISVGVDLSEDGDEAVATVRLPDGSIKIVSQSRRGRPECDAG
jgi:hypothetical protein